MHFPVYLRIGSLSFHPHQVFEVLAYVAGFAWYIRERRRQGDVLRDEQRLWLVVAAVVGGLLGSRLLYVLEEATQSSGILTGTASLLGGKSIVGGLLGGLAAVELVKKWFGVTVATGDLLAIPLAIGMAVGRIGCFLTGLADQTYGVATSLPWGIDFGDGVPRHPTQLYEMVFLLALAVLLGTRGRHLPVAGDRFKLFMIVYLTFRLLVDFLKPATAFLGLAVIQWACLAALVYYAPHVRRVLREAGRG